MAGHKKVKLPKKMNNKIVPVIDKHGLGDFVCEMISEGATIDQMREALAGKGCEVSRTAISRYRNNQLSNVSVENIRHALSEHVEGALPSDLQALEDLERISLEWSKENRKKFNRNTLTNRIDALLLPFREEFRASFYSAKPDSREEKAVVKRILSMAMDLVNDEVSHRKFRLQSAKQAMEVIRTKLAFSGILEGAGGGNIIIKGYGADKNSGVNKNVSMTGDGSGRLRLVSGESEASSGGSESADG